MVVSPNLPSDALDTTLNTLNHRHSRAVCHYFRYHSTEVATVDDLVLFISEHDGQATDENDIAVHLHHATLPKLADAGFVDYDPRSETVRYREPEPVEVWLDHVVEEGEVPI